MGTSASPGVGRELGGASSRAGSEGYTRGGFPWGRMGLPGSSPSVCWTERTHAGGYHLVRSLCTAAIVLPSTVATAQTWNVDSRYSDSIAVVDWGEPCSRETISQRMEEGDCSNSFTELKRDSYTSMFETQKGWGCTSTVHHSYTK